MSAPGAVPPVSAIADVLALWGHDGWLTPPLHPVVPANAPVIARVRTITMQFASSGAGLAPIYDLISNDLDGCALLVAGAHTIASAVWGEILATSAQRNGAAAVLVDGSVRDRPAMAALGLPIYAAAECVVGPNGLAHVTALDHHVKIGHVEVATDDIVVVDDTGCVRVRADQREAVLEAARKYAVAEEAVLAAMRGGEQLASAYQYKKSVVEELRGA